MSKTAKTVSIILIIVFIALSGALATISALGYKGHHDEAIIIIPGFLGSYLLDADDGEIYWDPIYPTAKTGMNLINRFFSIMQDEEGNSINNVRPATPDDTADFAGETKSLNGGVMDTYTDTYERTKARYGDKYDVVVWQYDWRVDNLEAARKLDSFIKENGWKKVVLLPHSMGGIVASTYLSLGQEQRDKVSLYCSFATPYFGVVDIIGLMEIGEFPFVNEQVTTLIGKAKILQKLAVNMPALFQMLPGEELLNTDYYKEELEDDYRSYIYIEQEDGSLYPLTTWEEVYDFYCSRPWANYSAKSGKTGLKKIFTDNVNYNANKLYVTVNGERKHVTDLVDSYYVGGTNGSDSTSGSIIIRRNGSAIRLGATFADGTVVTTSTLRGNEPDGKRYFLYRGYAHTNTMTTDALDSSDDPIDMLYGKIDALGA